MFRHLLFIFALSGCVLSKKIKHEGSKCRWNGLHGTCVNFYKCQSAMDYIKNRTHPPICLFQDIVPIICCTDCSFVDDTRKIIFNKNLGFLELNGPKSQDKCVHYVDKLQYPCKNQYTVEILRYLDPISKCYTIGESLTGFITQSPTLPPRKETYMALLGYGGEVKNAKWLCAGAIISEKYIITAAHCLSDSLLGPVKYMAVDIVSRTDPAELWQIYDVKRTIPHPEYNPPSKYHDIALVETMKVITFSEAVLPACLHTDNFAQKSAETIVWGSTEDQGSMIPATLSQFDEIQCSFMYPTQDSLPNGFDNKTQSCFGNMEKPKDSCQSDSGSPLVANYHTQSCAPMIIGVTSFDRTCGTFGSSGLYTRVGHYVPWIENIVWP